MVFPGESAAALLLSHSHADVLPPYNDEKVKIVKKEICELFTMSAALRQTLAQSGSVHGMDKEPRMEIPILWLARNRQALQLYHSARLADIREIAWETGIMPKSLESSLTKDELQYFQQYSRLIQEYCQNVGNLQLTQSLTPPRDEIIRVRALTTLGHIVTGSGNSIPLREGVEYYMNKSDAEQLIRQGYLAHIV